VDLSMPIRIWLVSVERDGRIFVRLLYLGSPDVASRTRTNVNDIDQRQWRNASCLPSFISCSSLICD
jgi:hypothetical protein